MKPIRDPEGAELEHLLAAHKLTRTIILEIGCGDGNLTWQYAGLPALVVGIDPKAADLQEARRQQPANAPDAVFTQSMAEALPFPAQAFDTVLFASSF